MKLRLCAPPQQKILATRVFWGNILDTCLRTLRAAVQAIKSPYSSHIAASAAAAAEAAVIERRDKKSVAPTALTIAS